MDLGLGGRVALVTGGNRGIGYAIAGQLCREGASVVICGRDRTRGQRAAAELGATWLAADVSSEADVGALIATTLERLGRLDVVVNNAGRFTGAPIHETTDDQWLDGLHTKVLGAMRVVRHAREALIRSGQGRVVNVSGITSELVVPGVAVTGLANSAMNALTAYLANDLRAQGVTVNCVVPGYTRSEVWQERIDRYAEDHQLTTEAAMAAILAERGMGEGARWGRPEEVAAVVAFLASGPASYLNGATIRVDGAQLPVASHP